MSDLPTLLGELGRGAIATLKASDWESLAAGFEVLESHDTQFAGMLLVVRGPSGLAAVEEPSAAVRVVRPLADESAARAFVAQRLALYERMWDGCGCKVEYSG